MSKRTYAVVTGSMLQINGGRTPPIMAPPIDERFMPAIGRLVAYWAQMEFEMGILIEALLKHNDTEESGWRGRPFEKRRDLLCREWATFSVGSNSLRQFLNRALRKIAKVKVLRDHICHGDLQTHLSPGKPPLLRFYNKDRTKQMSRRYSLEDFEVAIHNAHLAAGEFYWLTDPSYTLPLPSPDIQRLRSLPNTDQIRFPT